MTFVKHTVNDELCENPASVPVHGVSFGAKIKIEGVPASVRVSPHGFATAQGKEYDLTLDDDPYGFAAWVNETHDTWGFSVKKDTIGNVIFYGSWAGENIRSGKTAVSKLRDQYFFVFAVYMEDSDTMIVDPDLIERMVPDLDNIIVLPWDVIWTQVINLDNASGCEKFTTLLQNSVKDVLEQDPFIFGVFGVEGTGGGWVVSPMCDPGMNPNKMKTVDRYWYDRLTFKVTGDNHVS